MSQQLDDFKRHTERLKQKVSCNDLADRLNIKRQGKVSADGKAVYFAPWGSKENTTLSVFDGGAAWADHAAGGGGSCIDLYMRAKNVDFKEAVKSLSEMYGVPLPKAEQDPNAAPRREQPLHEMIAWQCLKEADKCIEYLAGRAISEEVIRRAIGKKTLGYNEYRNPKYPEGEVNHGGPAVGFIVTTPNPGHVVAVEMRYIDPAINGKVKNKCLGDKAGNAWCSNWQWVLSDKCETVYITEGPINALSIETAGLPRCGAIATMGTANVDNIDWRFLRGKRVLICLDHNDKVQQDPKAKLNGYRAGLWWAWRLHERLTVFDVSAQLVDQDKWPEGQDVNDQLQKDGVKVLAERLGNVEEWLIPGLNPTPTLHSRSRVWLPTHHFHKYTRFRVTADTCRWITGWKTVKEGDGGAERQEPTFEDVATFRVAALSRVSIQSALATMTGEVDSSPRTLFAVSAQAPRHKHRLVRAVLEDRHVHKMEKWEQFGSVVSQAGFRRMISVLETTTDIGAREAVNLVGLCWRAGKLAVNEGHECYFSEPELQCPYTNLLFPRGTAADGREVVRAYQATFKKNAAATILVWALGAHLKVLLGFWPHLTLQASKGAGKSTLTDRLQTTVGMTIFSGKTLDSAYRIMKSVCHTVHPVGWEELSARSQILIGSAVSVLQECYNHKSYSYGPQNIEMLSCAPVLLIGEDVPVPSLIGKLVAVSIDGKQGDMLPDELPKFPVRQWLEFLTAVDKLTVRESHRRLHQHCMKLCMAPADDPGANRMAGNYAALLVAWDLLCEFLDIPTSQGSFGGDLLSTMNTHIGQTSGEREPWVWIVEIIVSEMAAREFRYPACFQLVEHAGEQVPCLLIRTGHMIDHISRTPALRSTWDSLPIKTDRVLKHNLQHAGVLLMAKDGKALELERTLGGDPFNPGQPGRRVSHMVAIDLKRLAQFGVHAVGDASVLPETVAAAL